MTKADFALAISLISLAISFWVAVHDRRRKLAVQLRHGWSELSDAPWIGVTVTNLRPVPVTVKDFLVRVETDGVVRKSAIPGFTDVPATLAQSEQAVINAGPSRSWSRIVGVSALDTTGKEWRVSRRAIRRFRREMLAKGEKA